MKTTTTLLLFLILLFTIPATAQNYPDNVIDSDCFTESESVVWGIREAGRTGFTAHTYPMTFTGDIDNDGLIEIVAAGSSTEARTSNSIVVYDHQMNLKGRTSTGSMYTWGGNAMAIADVDLDGIAEIFIHSTNGNLECYNFNGSTFSLKWTSPLFWQNISTYVLAIADINADGIPELLAYDKIFNAQTGECLLQLPNAVGGITYTSGSIGFNPVMADFDLDGILEVAGGNNVFKVNITNVNGTTGNTFQLWKTLTQPSWVMDGATSVCDIDLDGFLEMVVVGRNYMYVWTPFSGPSSSPSLMGYKQFSYSNQPGSRATIADIDNDGYPEIIWTYPYQILAYKYNSATRTIENFWSHPTSDASGVTCVSTFDFNLDGSMEIVYRDETHLRIMNGSTGLNITTFNCPSPTSCENPVIADIDKDGEAEIIISSSSLYDGTGQICFYKSDGSRWAPTRYVWNQHGYNVVHINNDLTVPANNFNPTTTFTTTSGDVIRPFNNFLQQATTINQFGEPFFGLPDLTFIGGDGDGAVQVENYCDSAKITFCIQNTGDAPCPAPIHSTLLAGDENGMGIYVHVSNEPIDVGETACFSFTVRQDQINPYMPVDQLTLVLNSNSSDPNEECDYENNILTFPFSLKAVLDFEEHLCAGSDFSGHGFTIPIDSIPTAGTYTFTREIPNGNGCDTLKTLTLHVHDETETEISVEACNEYRYNNILYTESGTYTFNFTSVYGCDSTVILHLTIHALDLRIINEKEDFCEEFSTTLSVETSSPSLFFLWNTGEITSSINIEQSGVYSVTASAGNCNISASIVIPECEFSIYIPNAISPSKPDGVNDIFFIPWKVNPDAIYFEISIYDRWGTLIFYSKNPHFRWDGSFKGKISHNTMYNYIIKYQGNDEEMQTIKGTILVL